MQAAALAAVHLPWPNSCFNSNPPPPPPPPLFFLLCALQSDLHTPPLTPCAHPTPPALLQAGHSDKTSVAFGLRTGRIYQLPADRSRSQQVSNPAAMRKQERLTERRTHGGGKVKKRLKKRKLEKKSSGKKMSGLYKASNRRQSHQTVTNQLRMISNYSLRQPFSIFKPSLNNKV